MFSKDVSEAGRQGRKYPRGDRKITNRTRIRKDECSLQEELFHLKQRSKTHVDIFHAMRHREVQFMSARSSLGKTTICKVEFGSHLGLADQ